MFSSFGWSQDMLTDELRIESFFRADAESANLFKELARHESSHNPWRFLCPAKRRLNDSFRRWTRTTTRERLQENQSAPRIGRDNQITRERELLTKVRTITSQCLRQFVSGDRVVIRWKFRFDWLDETFTEIEEIAYQRWEGEHIAEETFFYDPAQRVPLPAVSSSKAR
jgi:hypothetical protein